LLVMRRTDTPSAWWQRRRTVRQAGRTAEQAGPVTV
jgi:hypothetical protein